LGCCTHGIDVILLVLYLQVSLVCSLVEDYRAGKEWKWVTDIHAGCLLPYLTLPYNTTTPSTAEG